MPNPHLLSLDGVDLRVDGLFPRIARMVDEVYVPLGEPPAFLASLRRAEPAADVFTFVQELDQPEPRHPYAMEHDELAVLRVSSFRHWMDQQIRFKARNKLKKSMRLGVETRVVDFSDGLLRDIMRIHNESPLRQGKRNRHYGKDLDTVRREHATFIERSEFVGAYLRGELIGFAKLTHAPAYSILMNIVAMVAHRDKAPSNALLARAIERVAERGIPLLNYGIWGRGGLNEFKASNAFECLRLPRYHVPLTARGSVALGLGLHRPWRDRLPEPWVARAAELRGAWNAWRYAGSLPRPAQEPGHTPAQPGNVPSAH